jgi:hypothetical protein
MNIVALKKDILLFSYFKGHGDGLHLAVSEDGYRWSALNDDRIFLHPNIGTERIMRDPCLYYGHNGVFHLVWTSGWHERGIGYCSTRDLLDWSPQIYLPVMAHEEKARNCWAPEIFYDQLRKQYMIYWSTTIDGKFPETQPYGDDGLNHRIYYVTTSDFIRFSDTKLLYDGGFNVIDANIVQNGPTCFLFMKDETLSPPNKHLRFATGDNVLNFGAAGDAITPNHYWAEGPTALHMNDEWLVYFDKYKINQMGAIRSKDMQQWEDISHHLEFPYGAQHGYVQRIPRSAIQHLLNDSEGNEST